MMERSLLYRLHGSQIKPNVVADPAKWQEVYRSKYGRVRIYKVCTARASRRPLLRPVNEPF